MERIFVGYPPSENIARVFRYDFTSALTVSMHIDDDGFYHSKRETINLKFDRPRKSIPIAGWDLGRGNILTSPYKVCECCCQRLNGIYYVAYTTISENRQGAALTIVQVSADAFASADINAFNNVTEIFNYTDHFNSHLTCDESHLFWREYPSDSPGFAFVGHRYDLSSHQHSISDCREEISSIDNFSSWTEEHVFCHEGENLKSLILLPPTYDGREMPAIVICPGGPHSEVPAARNMPKIIRNFTECGFIVIYPLRRGVRGMGRRWEDALISQYGIADIDDIVYATSSILCSGQFNINKQRVGLYGGSYGGYNALLIAGKRNEKPRLFNAICSHCGIYDLRTYPSECSALKESVMQTYGNTKDEGLYKQRIMAINPASYVSNWSVPMFLVHTIDDTASWFGQSVRAYNEAIALGKNVDLMLAPGPHSYNISNGDKLLNNIVEFFQRNI